jgi:hypothetical protein
LGLNSRFRLDFEIASRERHARCLLKDKLIDAKEDAKWWCSVVPGKEKSYPYVAVDLGEVVVR